MKKIRQLITVMLTMACFFCTVQAIVYGRAEEQQEQTGIFQLMEACDADTAINLQNSRARKGESDVLFTLWEERKGALVCNPEQNRSVQGTALIVCGNSGLVFKSSRTIGIMQKKECLLDAKMAQQLFGSTNVEGKYVEIDGVSFKVAGMLCHTSNTILFQAEPGMDVALNGVSIKGAGQDCLAETARKFSEETGLWAEPVPVHLYRIWGRAASQLVPLFLLMLLLRLIGRMICRYHSYPVTLLLLLLAWTGVSIVFYWMMGIQFVLPREYLPSKWSDFEFWSKLWEQKWGEAVFLLEAEKSLPLLYDYWNFIRTFFYSAAAFFLAHATLLKWKLKSGKQLFSAIVFFLLLAFLAVVGNGAAGRKIVDNPAVWLLLPAFSCGKYILTKTGKVLEEIIVE